MLEKGKEKLLEQGVKIPDSYMSMGSLNALPKDAFPDGSIYLGVCSLVLDCTSAGKEREDAIRGMSDSIQKDGHIIITIPESELDSKIFHKMLAGFADFGLTDEHSVSGFVKGKNESGTIIGLWLYVLKKTGVPKQEIDVDKLTFKFEREQNTRRVREERRVQNASRNRAQKAPTVAEYVVCKPDNGLSENWVEKGHLDELVGDSLLSYLRGLSLSQLSKLGYAKEYRVRDGREELRIVPLTQR